MLLAAGRGERMRPLTDTLPKSLLVLRGKPLIAHHLERLAAAGLRDIVINTGWLGEKIPAALGDGSAYGVRIQYSAEGWPALETGGGLKRALPLLGTEPFLAVNADVFTDYPFTLLAERTLAAQELAHLVMVANPAHNARGDFALAQGRVHSSGHTLHTYSGIGIIRPELIQHEPAAAFPLAPLLRKAMDAGRVAGELYRGVWRDIGTPQRLAELESSPV